MARWSAETGQQPESMPHGLAGMCMNLGLMISPLSLVILGNGAGHLGRRLLWALPLFALFNLWTAHLHTRLLDRASPSKTEKHPTPLPQGFFPLALLRFAALVPFALSASTLISAMAGYAINEIFFYWFPNLLFSVCLILAILLINLTSPGASRIFQNLAICIFLAAMAALLVTGFSSAQKPVLEPRHAPHFSELGLRALLLLFWPFMGADLAVRHESDRIGGRPHGFFLTAAFVVALAVFSFWGWTSLQYVSQDRLAGSTVPHSMTARAISGESGRRLMGIAVLAGSFASLNTLLRGMGDVVASMAESRQIFPMFARRFLAGHVTTLILSLGTLCMLLTGMAGKELTETFVRGGFYTWLMWHALFNLQAGRKLHRLEGPRNLALTVTGFSVALVYMGGVFGLMATDPSLRELGLFMGGCLVLSSLAVISRNLGHSEGARPAG